MKHVYKKQVLAVFIGKDGKVKKVFHGGVKDVEEEFHQWTGELL